MRQSYTTAEVRNAPRGSFRCLKTGSPMTLPRNCMIKSTKKFNPFVLNPHYLYPCNHAASPQFFYLPLSYVLLKLSENYYENYWIHNKHLCFISLNFYKLIQFYTNKFNIYNFEFELILMFYLWTYSWSMLNRLIASRW